MEEFVHRADRDPRVPLEWRCTVAFGADGAASIAYYSDPGADVDHDGSGHYTIHFPLSSFRRVEALTLLNASGNANTAHPHELLADRVTVHTEVNGTLTDPDDGASLFVTMLLGDLDTQWPRSVL